MTTPDLSDKYPHVDFLNLQFTNFGKKGFFSGKIETAICPDDNSKVKQILGEEGDGKILIVDGQGSTKVALMGDMIAESAEKNNWQAVIINGCVRDVEALSNFKLGIFALGSVPKKSEKKDRGEIGINIKFGDISIESGNWAYADESGILISKDQLDLD
jgi:regulator of ribonuclease activity A